MKYTLRDYQTGGAEQTLDFLLNQKKGNGIVYSPTGSGKSLTLGTAAVELARHPSGGPVIVLQPTKEILEQNDEKIRSYGFRTAICSATKGKRDLGDVTLATIGTVFRHPEWFEDFAFMLMDECHLAGSKDNSKIVVAGKDNEFYHKEHGLVRELKNQQGIPKGKVLVMTEDGKEQIIPKPKKSMHRTFLDALPHIRSVGFTASPYRLTQDAAGSQLHMITRTRPRIFDRFLHWTQNKELFDAGYLAKLEYFRIKGFKREKIPANSTGAEYNEQALQLHLWEQNWETRGKVKVNFKTMLADVVERVLAAGRKHVLVFTSSIAESEYLASELRGECAILTGETPKSGRESLLADFKSGDIKVVTNAHVLIHGFDFPELDCVIDAAPTMSLARYYQKCLDMETEILTQRGFLKYAEIVPEDKAAGYDLKSGEITWSPILQQFKRPLASTERFMSAAGPQINMRITNTHDLIVKSRRTTGPWRKEPAERSATRKETFCLPISGMETRPGAPLTEDELCFLGLFLSDGSLNRHNNAITITQSSSKRHRPIVRNIEHTLSACGFRFGKCLRKRTGKDRRYAAMWHFSISYGQPRRREERYKRGWKALAPFIDKNVGDAFEALTVKQVGHLLTGIIWGDGLKTVPATWARRTEVISLGDNKLYADRLQSLLIRSGYKCNVAASPTATGNVQYRAYVTKKSYVTLAGTNAPDNVIKAKPVRRTRLKLESQSNEDVWCITTGSGTIITRRSGKVVIMGNCGRGIRIHPNKESTWIIDMVGGMESFGKIEDLTLYCDGESKWNVYGRPGLGKEVALTHVYLAGGNKGLCPKCLAPKFMAYYEKKKNWLPMSLPPAGRRGDWDIHQRPGAKKTCEHVGRGNGTHVMHGAYCNIFSKIRNQQNEETEVR